MIASWAPVINHVPVTWRRKHLACFMVLWWCDTSAYDWCMSVWVQWLDGRLSCLLTVAVFFLKVGNVQVISLAAGQGMLKWRCSLTKWFEKAWKMWCSWGVWPGVWKLQSDQRQVNGSGTHTHLYMYTSQQKSWKHPNTVHCICPMMACGSERSWCDHTCSWQASSLVLFSRELEGETRAGVLHVQSLGFVGTAVQEELSCTAFGTWGRGGLSLFLLGFS